MFSFDAMESRLLLKNTADIIMNIQMTMKAIISGMRNVLSRVKRKPVGGAIPPVRSPLEMKVNIAAPPIMIPANTPIIARMTAISMSLNIFSSPTISEIYFMAMSSSMNPIIPSIGPTFGTSERINKIEPIPPKTFASDKVPIS